MSAVPKGGLILVTGVTGYIASWTALYLLESGYRVRGTARTLSKAEYLKTHAFAKYASNFEIVEVRDLEEPGAFNEAVKGVDGIAHIASPFHYDVTDPYKDLINPAVNGTLSLLNAAKDYAGPQLKHVVITSSFAAIMNPKPDGSLYTESDWNEASIKVVESQGAATPPAESYRASKTLAEQALWKFKAENKPPFSLSAVNPCFVFGPVIHQIANPESINTSVFLLFQYFSGEKKEIVPASAVQSFVDVRDVARAHIKALENAKADGERFLLSSDNFSWDQATEVLRRHYPDRKDKIVPPRENAAYGKSTLVNTKSKEVLGLTYIDFETSIVDTAKTLEQFV